MATTTAPLMSITASGKFGSSIVFDKRGRARLYVIPANPQTSNQGDVRQKLATVQAVLKKLSTTARDAIKTAAPTAYMWNSHAVKLCIGPGSAYYDAAQTAWAALDGTAHTAWDTAFASVVVPDVQYKADADVTSGQAAFIVAYGLHSAGITYSQTTPGASNASAWATALL